MSLYEQVLRATPKEKRVGPVWEALTSAVVVNLDAVARLYYEESPRVEWDLLEDFPNVAPPWPVAFYEFREPRRMNMNGTMQAIEVGGLIGLLAVARPYDPEEDVDHEGLAKECAWAMLTSGAAKAVGPVEAQRRLAGVTREDAWRSLSEAQRDVFRGWSHDGETLATREGLGWGVEAVLWVAPDGFAPLEIGSYRVPVLRDGRIPSVRGEDGDARVPVAFGLAPHPRMTDEWARGFTEDCYSRLHVPFLGISLAHCRNVEVVTTDEVELKPRQQKEVGIPHITIKTLEITPMRRVLDREGGMREHGSVQKALHICRGHFKDYRERGLFGRNRGIYWWDMAVRGRAERGAVIKDYAVVR